jgi:hypothetical protein
MYCEKREYLKKLKLRKREKEKVFFYFSRTNIGEKPTIKNPFSFKNHFLFTLTEKRERSEREEKGVNFTNLLPQSVNTMVVILWRCSFSPTKIRPLYQYVQLDIHSSFVLYTVHQQDRRKFTSAKAARKMLVKLTQERENIRLLLLPHFFLF